MKAVMFSGVPELIMFAAVFALGGDGRFFAVFSAAIIHEAAHVAAAALAGVPLRLCRTGFAGAVLVYDTSCASLGAEAAICAAGPGVGLAVTAIGYAAGIRSYFVAANAALSIFNLLPVSYLDGGGILSSLLEMHLTEIEKVSPAEGEEEQLEAMRAEWRGTEQLRRHYERAQMILRGEETGLLEQIGHLERALELLAGDDEDMAAYLESAVSFRQTIAELERKLRRPPLPQRSRPRREPVRLRPPARCRLRGQARHCGPRRPQRQ